MTRVLKLSKGKQNENRNFDRSSLTGANSRDLKELERHHIFPREYLQRELELDDVEEDPVEAEVIISNLGNITFVLKEVNASINDEPPSDYMKNYIARARLHFIAEDDQLWTREAYESGAFQEARLKLIFEAAQKHFPNVFETDEAAKVQRLAF